MLSLQQIFSSLCSIRQTKGGNNTNCPNLLRLYCVSDCHKSFESTSKSSGFLEPNVASPTQAKAFYKHGWDTAFSTSLPLKNNTDNSHTEQLNTEIFSRQIRRWHDCQGPPCCVRAISARENQDFCRCFLLNDTKNSLESLIAPLLLVSDHTVFVPLSTVCCLSH